MRSLSLALVALLAVGVILLLRMYHAGTAGKLVNFASRPALSYAVPSCDMAEQMAAHLTAWSLATVANMAVLPSPALMSLNRADSFSRRSPIPIEWLVDMGEEPLPAERFGIGFLATDWARVPIAGPLPPPAPEAAIADVHMPLQSAPDAMPSSMALHNKIKAVIREQGARVIDLGQPFPTVTLDQTHRTAMRELALTFKFSPILEELAQRIIAGARDAYKQELFTSLHFGEAGCNATADQATLDKILEPYKATVVKEGLHNPKLPVFVSSSVFGFEDFVALRLASAGYAPAVFTRTSFIEKRYLHMYPEEVLEAIDFLVHRHSAAFVGHSGSTFSFLVSQFRAADGVKRSALVPHARQQVLRAGLEFA